MRGNDIGLSILRPLIWEGGGEGGDTLYWMFGSHREMNKNGFFSFLFIKPVQARTSVAAYCFHQKYWNQ